MQGQFFARHLVRHAIKQQATAVQSADLDFESLAPGRFSNQIFSKRLEHSISFSCLAYRQRSAWSLIKTGEVSTRQTNMALEADRVFKLVRYKRAWCSNLLHMQHSTIQTLISRLLATCPALRLACLVVDV